MCRSTAQGGRRCSGASRGGASATDRAAVSVPAAIRGNTSTIPDREAADRLGASIPADRTDAFGRTLNERDRRFFALRESGYKGPIDQDGYPDTTSASAATLRRMANDRGEKVDW